MKKTFIKIYTIVISLTFIFAISFFGINTYRLYKNGKANAESRLEKMCLRIKMINPEIDFSSNDFNEKILSAIDNKSDFASLTIKINNQDYFKYPSKQTKELKKSSLIYSDSRNFKLNEKNISIYSDIYIIQPKQVSIYLKYSLMIVIFATILTAVLLIIDNNKKEEKENKQNELEKEIDELLPGTYAVKENVKTENIEETQTEDTLENKTEENVFEDGYTDKEKHEDFVNQIINTNPNYAAKKITEQETIQYKNSLSSKEEISLPSEEIKPMKIDNTKNPEGLFSPTTGFGWESYLLTRLDNELNRATASEIDLGLFVIKIPDIQRTNEKMKSICQTISSHFQFKDLIFEYNNDSVVGLKIGANSDQAFHFAEKLFLDLSNIINGESKIFIGISTKTIRIISGERLLKEANEALNHAMNDKDSPIIAFKADADKYRLFIDNK